ncbi:hypothetical protein [Streptomyces chattanoogensis]|uniref:hypothetical protein n=1 Tax=Streptomyces chattanoogensis TaxID=66876 RepID=UPI0036A55154
MSTDFPDDLVRLQRDLDEAYAALRQFLDEHPTSPEPMDGWHDVRGNGYWHDRHKEPSPGWSDGDKQLEANLRQCLLRLVTKVHTHPHWDTLSGGDLVAARMKLKHVDDPTED